MDSCTSCGREWTDHDGIIATCAKLIESTKEIEKLRFELATLRQQEQERYRGWAKWFREQPQPVAQMIDGRMVQDRRYPPDDELPKLSDLIGICKDNPIDVAGDWGDPSYPEFPDSSTGKDCLQVAKLRFGCEPPHMPIADEASEPRSEE